MIVGGAKPRRVDDRSVRSILYDAAGHDRECKLSEVDLTALGDDQLLWVDLTGADASPDLPQQMREALPAPGEVEELQLFDGYYRFGIPCPDEKEACLQFVVGPGWVLTAGSRRPQFFDEFIEGDRGETLKGRMTPTAFVAALLLRHLDTFREEIAAVDTSIDKLDETILRGRERRSPLLTLAALRRRLSAVRGTLAAHRTLIRGLVVPDFTAHVRENDREFLSEVNRVFERLEDDVGRARETVIGSFELYASRVAQDTNQLLKMLTIVTVITGIVGAVAGVFGMNFDTPVSHSGLHGFLIVTAAMLAASLTIVLIAFWRRWI